jgi:type VI secretion system protein ImpC
MNEESPGGTFRVDAGVRPARNADEVSERPFHVALLGDFSGRSTRDKTHDALDLSDRTPLQVDRDDLDTVLARLAPSIEITPPGSTEALRLSFDELDDFHPDQLLEREGLFGALKAKRAEIADPAGFARFKEQLESETPEPSVQPPDDSPPAQANGNLLDQILEEAPTQTASAALEDGGLQDFVKRVVAPHEVQKQDATQAELLAQFDEQIASLLRWVLHRTEFQELESLWRGIWFLCRRLETGASLKLFLIDISKEELLRDQNPDVPLENTGLYRLLVESSVGTPGAIPWSLLVGCYSFVFEMDDLKLQTRLGAITSLADASWLSAADSSVVGCSSFGTAADPSQWEEPDLEAWNAVRLLPYASRLGLAMPRFLLRLPYGRETDECDRLAFEEFVEEDHEHENYLWGNPAFLCALLVSQAYAAGGSGGRTGGSLEVDKLPLHLRKIAGETVNQPCAEAMLTERALTRVSDHGLMALASLKDRDAVRLLRFQSIADPPTSLGGPWV